MASLTCWLVDLLHGRRGRGAAAADRTKDGAVVDEGVLTPAEPTTNWNRRWSLSSSKRN